MVSTTVDNAPAFLQLRDKYKQQLVEDARLTKATDLAAQQHVLLTSDIPDAWKRPQLKAVGRQLRHWTKKVRQPFGAPASGVSATGAATPDDDDFEAGPVQEWFMQLVKASQGIKRGTSSAGPRKPPVPPKPKFTPSAKKLKFTPQVSSAELAQELPFSVDSAPKPWNTPSLAVKKKSERKPPKSPRREPKVWPRKPWSGKREKPGDGTDSETPRCCAPIPTETATTLATRGQVI